MPTTMSNATVSSLGRIDCWADHHGAMTDRRGPQYPSGNGARQREPGEPAVAPDRRRAPGLRHLLRLPVRADARVGGDPAAGATDGRQVQVHDLPGRPAAVRLLRPGADLRPPAAEIPEKAARLHTGHLCGAPGPHGGHDLLDPLRHRPRVDLSGAAGPGVPQLAEPRHAHLRRGLRPNGNGGHPPSVSAA